jgi:ribonuclease J
MPNKVKVFALGGLDENGKNMYVVEINDDIFVFEAGIRYPESSMPGIDFIIPDTGYLIKNKHRVKAYFIGHGHDDIMAALPYVLKDVPAPIYCSRITAELIKLSSRRIKMNPNYDFRIVKPNTVMNMEGYEANFFSTTHSVGESLGIGLETGNGLIVYTSDFIIDYGALPQYRTDINMLSKLRDKRVLLLMSESIDCAVPGHTSPGHKLTPIVETQFKEHKGRIVMSFYTQNLFGVREALDLAVKTKRKIYVHDKEMQEILRFVTEFGILSIPPQLMIDKDELNRPGNDDILVLVSGTGEYLYQTLEKLVLSDNPNELTFRKSDLIIVASPSIPGLEVLSAKVIDSLYKTGCKIINIKKKQLYSMHAHTEDIKMMLSMLKPKYYMPVKGEFRHLIANAQVALSMGVGYNHTNTFVCDNGMVVYLEDGNFKGFIENIEVGEVLIDGLGIGDVGSQVILDRQKLSDNGVMILGISVDKQKKKIIAGPDIQMRGLIFLKDADDFLKDLVNLFSNLVNEALERGDVDEDEVRFKIRDKINIFVRKSTGKDPMVLPVIVSI